MSDLTEDCDRRICTCGHGAWQHSTIVERCLHHITPEKRCPCKHFDPVES